MLEIIVFILVWLFVIVPLYTFFKVKNAANKLNSELLSLARDHQIALAHGRNDEALAIFKIAKRKVMEFRPEVKYTEQEIINMLPAIREFPYWEVGYWRF